MLGVAVGVKPNVTVVVIVWVGEEVTVGVVVLLGVWVLVFVTVGVCAGPPNTIFDLPNNKAFLLIITPIK